MGWLTEGALALWMVPRIVMPREHREAPAGERRDVAHAAVVDDQARDARRLGRHRQHFAPQ